MVLYGSREQSFDCDLGEDLDDSMPVCANERTQIDLV